MIQSILLGSGPFFFRYRNAVFPLAMLAIFVAFPPRYPLGSATADLWLDLLGLLIGCAGQALRGAVIGYAYIKRGGLNKEVYADKLVTTGFFGTSRNPLYVGNALILVGTFVIENNPWAYLAGAVFFGYAYAAIIATEENYLRAKFGDEYDAYCREVPRWWPRMGKLAKATEGMSFDWRRVVAKDYSTAATWIGTAALVMAYDAFANEGLAAAQGGIVAAFAILAVTVAAALGIRAAKKSGKLVAS